KVGDGAGGAADAALPRRALRVAATAAAGRLAILPDDLAAVRADGALLVERNDRSGSTDRGHERGRGHGVDAALPLRLHPEERTQVARGDQHRLALQGRLA